MIAISSQLDCLLTTLLMASSIIKSSHSTGMDSSMGGLSMLISSDFTGLCHSTELFILHCCHFRPIKDMLVGQWCKMSCPTVYVIVCTSKQGKSPRI